MNHWIFTGCCRTRVAEIVIDELRAIFELALLNEGADDPSRLLITFGLGRDRRNPLSSYLKNPDEVQKLVRPVVAVD